MVKIYVLDTSVLIHDYRSPLNFGDNIVIIPFVVLEELDTHKESRRDTAMPARRAIRVLDELREKGNLIKGVATPGGGILIVDGKNYSPTDISIRPTTADNIIICTGYKWQQYIRQQQPLHHQKAKRETKKRDNVVDWITQHFQIGEVKIVSKDINLRVKSEACGVATEDYKHDRTIKSENEVYSGIIHIPITPGNFKEFSGMLCDSGPAGTLQEDFDGLVAFPQLIPNQCCVFHTPDGKNVLAIYKRNGDARFVHVPKPSIGKGHVGVVARNIEQAFALALLRDPSISLITLAGIAGGGKTLMALLAGVEAVIQGPYSQLLIYRPNTELGEPMGYLPGTLDEKFEPWKQPIIDNLELISAGGETGPKDGKSDTKSKKWQLDIKGLLSQKKISIEPVNFIQGRSLHYRFVIVDETQNFRPGDIAKVVTRIGKGAKIVLTGDIQQVVNDYLDASTNGLTHVIEGMKGENLFGHVTFVDSERSELAEIAARRL
jgi:PhoH-like ATPase